MAAINFALGQCGIDAAMKLDSMKLLSSMFIVFIYWQTGLRILQDLTKQAMKMQQGSMTEIEKITVMQHTAQQVTLHLMCFTFTEL